jgi:hypothetical protein
MPHKFHNILLNKEGKAMGIQRYLNEFDDSELSQELRRRRIHKALNTTEKVIRSCDEFSPELKRTAINEIAELRALVDKTHTAKQLAEIKTRCIFLQRRVLGE